MTPDDEICYCYHVSLRKLLNFARRVKPVHPAQLSDCLGAGTGCGWCVPMLCRIARGAADDATWRGLPPEQYAADRQAYIREKRPRHTFDPPVSTPVEPAGGTPPENRRDATINSGTETPAGVPFALLEHTTRSGVHWDLLLGLPGLSGLATWRINQNPITLDGPAAAERLADHRVIYLEYEGPISGDRGEVRRVERGIGRLETHAADHVAAWLKGSGWEARIELRLECAPLWSLSVSKTR